MAKAIRVRDGDLRRALEAGAEYLIVGNRRFLLVEVADQGDDEFYDVTDPEEVQILDEALQDTSRRLRGAEARQYLIARRCSRSAESIILERSSGKCSWW